MHAVARDGRGMCAGGTRRAPRYCQSEQGRRARACWTHMASTTLAPASASDVRDKVGGPKICPVTRARQRPAAGPHACTSIVGASARRGHACSLCICRAHRRQRAASKRKREARSLPYFNPPARRYQATSWLARYAALQLLRTRATNSKALQNHHAPAEPSIGHRSSGRGCPGAPLPVHLQH